MRSIELKCPGFEGLHCIGTQPNGGHDFLVGANCSRRTLEVLIFLDSRGICGQYSGSLVERILRQVKTCRRYLVVCRPLEITTWATLFNFLTINDLQPRKILTNMGFVDFTPKKRNIVEDARLQVEEYMGVGIATPEFIEDYVDGGGDVVPLYLLRYGLAYGWNISTVLGGVSTVVINSPIVSPGINIRRKRPKSFFLGLRQSNAFNRSIAGVSVIELPDFDETQTYDGVHYTDRGNELIFTAIQSYL